MRRASCRMAEAPEDDNKRKFREALERKKANAGGGSEHKDGGRKHGPRATGPPRATASSAARAASPAGR